jgi:Family of unknown function (DUF6544)
MELPELVRRYAEAVLRDSTPPVRLVRLTQTGEMILKPGGRRLTFQATEEFAANSVEFAWRARFPIFGPLSMHVTDSYEPPDGLLQVRVLGVPVRRSRGPELANGEALRYLAELPWVPHAIVANHQLQWRTVDDDAVEVSTDVSGEQVAVQLIFGDDEIVRTVAERPRLEAGGELTRWVGEYADYRAFGGIRMPARGEVSWELPDGPFTYWRATITSVETLS